MRLRVLALLLLVTAAATLTACGGAHHARASALDNRSRVIAAGDRYVAIGDSYTGAPLTGMPTAADGCLQSGTNYPHQVALALSLRLTDVSCGGADTSSVTGSQTTATGTRKRPQADAVGRDTALVTVSIGGNDGGVFSAVTSECLALLQGGPGRSCRAHDRAQGDRATSARIVAMQTSLEKALDAVIRRAPRARLLVVGYPDVLPQQSCAEFPVGSADLAWVRDVNTRLNDAEHAAATAVGAEFVDVAAVTTGHDICSAAPWAAGIQPEAPAAPFHPYAAEQAAVAGAIERTLATTTKP